MNHEEFNQVVEEQYRQSKKTLMKKADEYAQGDDRFWNFRRAAQVLGTTPEKALLGMFVKHMVSIMDIVELTAKGQGISPRELIDEKITDAVNYLLLLKGMLIGRINAVDLKKRFQHSTTTKGE